MSLRARIEQRLGVLLAETKQRRKAEAARASAESVANLAAAIERRAEALVERLVDPTLQRPVLDRAELAARWDLGDADTASLSPAEASLLRALLATEREIDPPSRPPLLYWPPAVAPAEIASALERTGDADATQLATALRQGWISPGTPDLSSRAMELAGAFAKWPLLDCARIVDVVKRVQEDRLRPAMAIDAGKEHHALMAAMRDFPKDPVTHRGKKGQAIQLGDRLEVLAPGDGGIQLTLPLEGINLNEAMVNTLRQWRGWEGLRHWAAVQRLLSIEGSRAGRVRWTLERHLDAIGASKRSREDPKFRQRVGHEVELLTRLELAIYAKDGTVRMRRALLTPTAKFDRIHGADWALEGMELEIHPMLYSGVRDPVSGEIGANWFPQATELPRLDHVHHPHALALGLILPIRWRWDWLAKQNHTRMKGLTLLATAGVPYKQRRASEAWSRLKRDLEELQRIGALGTVEWESEPWSEDGVCLLYPPQWARDRTVHQLPPVEQAALAPKEPLTGSELQDWRNRKGLSQTEAAKLLSVGVATIKRAEAGGEAALGPALAKAFGRLAGKA